MPNDQRIDAAIKRAAAKRQKPLTKAETARLYHEDAKTTESRPLTGSPASRKIVRRTVEQ
jgi:hypothetical protein